MSCIFKRGNMQLISTTCYGEGGSLTNHSASIWEYLKVKRVGKKTYNS